jgi:hypothetical protein
MAKIKNLLLMVDSQILVNTFNRSLVVMLLEVECQEKINLLLLPSA